MGWDGIGQNEMGWDRMRYDMIVLLNTTDSVPSEMERDEKRGREEGKRGHEMRREGREKNVVEERRKEESGSGKGRDQQQN